MVPPGQIGSRRIPTHRGNRLADVPRPLVGKGMHGYPLASLVRNFADGGDDVRVGPAAAEVAAHELADL